MTCESERAWLLKWNVAYIDNVQFTNRMDKVIERRQWVETDPRRELRVSVPPAPSTPGLPRHGTPTSTATTTLSMIRMHHKHCIQGSHRNLIIKLHDFSITIYAVFQDVRNIFQDVRKGNTEDHREYSPHIWKESQVSIPNENKQSKRWFVSCLTFRFGT